MIIGRYLNKQVLKAMLLVLMVLLLLFMGQRFILYLSDAAQGRFASEIVLQLLLYQSPVFISYLLPLSLFMGMLITLGKAHADQEMAVIAACGISNRQILRFFVPLMIILSVITGYLTLFQVPSAIYHQQQIIQEQQIKGDLSLITPGRFQQTSDGKRIIYVEKIHDDDRLEGIFFAQQTNDTGHGFSLIVSDQGRYWSDEDQKNYLVLENGNQYLGSSGSSKLHSSNFERYFMVLKSADRQTAVSKIKALSTGKLFANPTWQNQAELQWRIAAPLSIPLLILLALPLAKVPPRQGKFARLLPGLLLYITYMVLLLTMRGMVEDNKLSPFIGTWWVHLLLFGYAYSEFTNWQWFNKIRIKADRKSKAGI